MAGCGAEPCGGLRTKGGECVFVGFYAAEGLYGGVVGELGEFFAEGEVDVSDCAVSVFRDDEFGEAWFVGFVVVFAAEEEHDDVGVLF